MLQPHLYPNIFSPSLRYIVLYLRPKLIWILRGRLTSLCFSFCSMIEICIFYRTVVPLIYWNWLPLMTSSDYQCIISDDSQSCSHTDPIQKLSPSFLFLCPTYLSLYKFQPAVVRLKLLQLPYAQKFYSKISLLAYFCQTPPIIISDLLSVRTNFPKTSVRCFPKTSQSQRAHLPITLLSSLDFINC